MSDVSFPKTKFNLVRKVLLTVVLITISFTFGYFFGFKGFRASVKNFPNVKITREVPRDQGTLDFSLFWKVWDTLREKYYDKSKLIDSQMVYGAISGMVASLGDPYTAFIPPKEYKIVQEDLQGTFEGVGIQIGFKGNQLVVIAPLPGSPAEKADIKAGDFIIGIKDEQKNIDRGTVGIGLTEAVEAIRGPANTKVTLTLLRENSDKPITVDIIRQSINVPSIVLNFVGKDNSIAHVKILKFAGETMGEWEKTVPELVKKDNLKGMILDVRNNPGGYLQAAVDLASDFLNQGDVVVIEEAGNGQKSEYKVEKLGRFKKIKLVVLINKGSASASEILAGALKDQKRATVVGETSFGKGTIQEPQQINGGAGLHITIAKWLTPDEYWVNEVGLKPDIEVLNSEEKTEDNQLAKAIEILEQ